PFPSTPSRPGHCRAAPFYARPHAPRRTYRTLRSGATVGDTARSRLCKGQLRPTLLTDEAPQRSLTSFRTATLRHASLAGSARQPHLVVANQANANDAIARSSGHNFSLDSLGRLQGACMDDAR